MITSARAVCLGETMGLLAATSVGRLSHVGEMALGIGGAESNVAVALSRLGVPTAWTGRLGADAIGDRVVRELTAEGIVVHAVRDPDAPTGLMLKERLPGGRVRVWYHRKHASGARLVPSDVDAELVAGAELLHVTGISPALGEGPGAAARHAVALAHEAGTLVSVDVNHRSALWSDEAAAPALRALAASADLLYAGDDEARLTLGVAWTDPERLARGLAELGPSEVVIKQGAEGALALHGGTVLAEPAVPVEVVDPVGAGDAFVGAHLAGRLAGDGPAARLRAAVTAGALLCTVPGDWEALPFPDDLAAFGGPDVTR
ncbi:sugar kinase [Pseudonocardia nematodicida]|uniref:Sugar kinase n=1 Tax=Pseudonocardia nematodicida TaxID=1206997 RepID=A0ABV1K958_9PSEU